MKLSLPTLQQEANRSGFRVEIVEKVCHLQRLLIGFGQHPFLKNRLVLKGGTALNLFLFDLPRLSVDIDLNYIGQAEREAMLAERPQVEQAISDVCSREGMQVARLPEEHAGGKWRLRYSSAFGGDANLEVDLNFLLRIPLWPVERRNAPEMAGIQATQIAVLDLHELAAGKLAALFARNASRDLYDAHKLLTQTTLENERLRIAFLVYGGMNRKNWRTIRIEDLTFTASELQSQLIPMLRQEELTRLGDSSTWATQLISECQTALQRLLPFAPAEMQFLDRLLDDGEVRPELLTRDEDLAQRIAQHPGLLWKALNVRQHRK